jgi:hypothetical protein
VTPNLLPGVDTSSSTLFRIENGAPSMPVNLTWGKKGGQTLPNSAPLEETSKRSIPASHEAHSAVSSKFELRHRPMESTAMTSQTGHDGHGPVVVSRDARASFPVFKIIRTFSTRVSKTTEQVTELIPDQKLSYVLLSGLPLRNYQAVVQLSSPESGVTLVNWTASFQCRYGTGWFWRIFLNLILSRVAMQLAAAAAKLEPVGFRKS